jgi:hypothetical protein
VAGRPILVVPTGSDLAYSDGTYLFLPDGATSDTVMVQAAMISGGSLEPPGLRALLGRRGTTDRYVALETSRAVHALRDVLPPAVVDQAADLCGGQRTASPAESLERARSARVRGAPPWCGTIRPLSLIRRGTTGGADVTDSDLRAALTNTETLEEMDPEDDGDRSRILEMLAVPLSNPLATKMARLLGMRTTPSESNGGGQEFSVQGSRTGTGHGRGRRVADRGPARGVGRPRPAAGWTYDEWVHTTGSYRRGWCAVTELLPDTSVAAGPYAAAPDLALRAQLARLGLSDARHRRQPDGDTLDLTALVDHAAGRAAGSCAEPRVYEARRRTHRDLGVLVLLDASGSTGTLDGDREVFDAQRELAARLTLTLEALGDRVATYAFYSRGRRDVRFLRIKAFDERYGRAGGIRLAALAPGGYTRLGAAVRHATHVLTAQAGTASTLLVVIGDGLPYDDGYEQIYAQQDARRALTEAVERGVGCACISLRAANRPEVIEAVWGHVAHRVLDRPQDLASGVRPLFQQALASAHAHRRSDPRTEGPR